MVAARGVHEQDGREFGQGAHRRLEEFSGA
jgi:hypothetical protein